MIQQCPGLVSRHISGHISPGKSRFHHVFTTFSPRVHHVFTTCSPRFHHVSPGKSPGFAIGAPAIPRKVTSLSADPYLADFVDVELSGSWRPGSASTDGKTMGNPWKTVENHENPWKTYGKLMKLHGQLYWKWYICFSLYDKRYDRSLAVGGIEDLWCSCSLLGDARKIYEGT